MRVYADEQYTSEVQYLPAQHSENSSIQSIILLFEACNPQKSCLNSIFVGMLFWLSYLDLIFLAKQFRNGLFTFDQFVFVQNFWYLCVFK